MFESKKGFPAIVIYDHFLNIVEISKDSGQVKTVGAFRINIKENFSFKILNYKNGKAVGIQREYYCDLKNYYEIYGATFVQPKSDHL